MEKLTPNNTYWISTENYGVLKGFYKETGNPAIGYFQCDLVDGFLILNNGIHHVKDRKPEDDVKPTAPQPSSTKEEYEAMGWKR